MMNELNDLVFLASLITTLFAVCCYLVFFTNQREKIRQTARFFFLVSGISQTLYIGARLIITGYTPVSTFHESVMFFAWATTWAYLSFRWRYNVKNFGTFVSLLVLFLLGAAALVSRDIMPLRPVLQSYWLPLHAGTSLAACAFYSLAFCGSVMYLLQERELKKKRFGYFYSRLPSLDALDQLNKHCLLAGFVFLSLGILSGIFWSDQAFGVYWRWRDKEICSLLAWGIFLFLLQQRFSRGWRGRRVAMLTIVGFVIVLLALLGVVYPSGGAMYGG